MFARSTLFHIDGVAFPYGVLFGQAFGFSPLFVKSLEPYLQPFKSSKTITIGIRLRHPRAEDDESNVQRQASCIKELLDGLQRTKSIPIVPFVMADRPPRWWPCET